MCRHSNYLLINGRLLIDILIVCITSILGTLLIHAQIVDATGLLKIILDLGFAFIFRCKGIVGGIVFQKTIF